MTIRELYEEAMQNGSADKPIKIGLYEDDHLVDKYDLVYYADYSDEIIIPVDIEEE